MDESLQVLLISTAITVVGALGSVIVSKLCERSLRRREFGYVDQPFDITNYPHLEVAYNMVKGIAKGYLWLLRGGYETDRRAGLR